MRNEIFHARNLKYKNNRRFVCHSHSTLLIRSVAKMNKIQSVARASPNPFWTQIKSMPLERQWSMPFSRLVGKRCVICQILRHILRQVCKYRDSAWRMKPLHAGNLKYVGWKIFEGRETPLRALLIRLREHGQRICRRNEGTWVQNVLCDLLWGSCDRWKWDSIEHPVIEKWINASTRWKHLSDVCVSVTISIIGKDKLHRITLISNDVCETYIRI